MYVSAYTLASVYFIWVALFLITKTIWKVDFAVGAGCGVRMEASCK
jgi:hypothetical protein